MTVAQGVGTVAGQRTSGQDSQESLGKHLVVLFFCWLEHQMIVVIAEAEEAVGSDLKIEDVDQVRYFVCNNAWERFVHHVDSCVGRRCGQRKEGLVPTNGQRKVRMWVFLDTTREMIKNNDGVDGAVDFFSSCTNDGEIGVEAVCQRRKNECLRLVRSS